MSEQNEKQVLIQEIEKELEKLLVSDHLSETDKIALIRKASKALEDKT